MEIVLVAVGSLGLMMALSGWLMFGSLVICEPHETLVVWGRKGQDGRDYRLVRGGRTLRFPFLERVDRLAMGPYRVDVAVDDAVVSEGVAVRVVLDARIRLCSSSPGVHEAVARYLGQDPAVVVATGAAVLERVLRASVGEHGLAQIEDRDAFRQVVEQRAQKELEAVGLVAELRVEGVELV